MERKCGQCALKALKGGLCPIFNKDMSNEDGCPYFTTSPRSCEICGVLLPKGGVIENIDNSCHTFCENCATDTSCKTCLKSYECKFRTDKTCQEPLYVTVQQRRGNAIIQSQIQNPRRVQATCAQGCPCFNEEGLDDNTFCLRQTDGWCNRYDRKRKLGGE